MTYYQDNRSIRTVVAYERVSVLGSRPPSDIFVPTSFIDMVWAYGGKVVYQAAYVTPILYTHLASGALFQVLRELLTGSPATLMPLSIKHYYDAFIVCYHSWRFRLTFWNGTSPSWTHVGKEEWIGPEYPWDPALKSCLVQGGVLICGRMEPLHGMLPKNTVNAAFELTSLISYNTPRSSSNSNQDCQASPKHQYLRQAVFPKPI